MDKSWTPFEHQLWRKLSILPKKGRGLHLLVAFSGGRDSLALLQALGRLRAAAGFQLSAIYVHHGPGLWFSAREDAKKFCQDVCLEFKIHLFTPMPPKFELKSEEQLRRHRLKVIDEVRKEWDVDLVLTAHHQDDLLETRILRLIRGTGALGLQAIKEYSPPLWRPLLQVSRLQIENYLALERDHKFFDDPSNKEHVYLRNWLRHAWLPLLEAKLPGSIARIGQSLELILHSQKKLSEPEQLLITPLKKEKELLVLGRKQYWLASNSQKGQFWAHFLGEQPGLEYSQGLILEIIRRLDSSQKVHSFTIKRFTWSVDAKQITLRWQDQEKSNT